MDWITARNRKDKLVEMMKAGNWRGVLAEFSEDSYYREPLLVWIKTTFSCLEFIEAEVPKPTDAAHVEAWQKKTAKCRRILLEGVKDHIVSSLHGKASPYLMWKR